MSSPRAGQDPDPPPGLGAWWDGDEPDSAALADPSARSGKPRRGHQRLSRVFVPIGLVTATLVAVAAIVASNASAPEKPPAALASTVTDSSQPAVAPSPEPSIGSSIESAAPLAAEALTTLVVKGRSQANDYDRDLFGPPWLDVDRNGCDTRNDILRRDLDDVELKPETHGCVVLSGALHDPYSGRTIAFERGMDTSSEVQIDHVVALADAWQKGAREWDDDTRASFANDPLNLLAVDGTLNQKKVAGDAATWLPPDRSYWCPYAARIIAVKARYSLWVTQAEDDALGRILATCPDEPMASGEE